VLKLLLSGALLSQQMLVSPKRLLSDHALSEFASYAIPALIYFVNNNLLFYILQEVDPTTFQLLSQMKTIFTGLLFRVFLKRRLSSVQVLASKSATEPPATTRSHMRVLVFGRSKTHSAKPSPG